MLQELQTNRLGTKLFGRQELVRLQGSLGKTLGCDQDGESFSQKVLGERVVQFPRRVTVLKSGAAPVAFRIGWS